MGAVLQLVTHREFRLCLLTRKETSKKCQCFCESIIMLRRREKYDVRPEGQQNGRRLVRPSFGVTYVVRKAGPGIFRALVSKETGYILSAHKGRGTGACRQLQAHSPWLLLSLTDPDCCRLLRESFC